MKKRLPYIKSRIKTNEIFWIAVIVIYCSNFFNIGQYLPIVLLPYLIFSLFKIKFSNMFLLTALFLFSFSLVYATMLFFYDFNTTASVVGRLLFPISLFMLGYTIAGSNFTYKKVYRILFAVVISSTLYGFLSLLKTSFLYGNLESYFMMNGRFVTNLWNNTVLTATGLNTYISFGLVILPILFIKDRNIKLIKLYSVVCFILAFYTTIQLANRTGLLLIAASLLIVILVWCGLSAGRIMFLFFASFIVYLIKITYDSGIFGIKASVENTLIFSRLISSKLADDPRLKAWEASFEGLFKHPFGGRVTQMDTNYAHNLWLDIGVDAGVVPFMLLLIFTVLSTFSLYKFILSNHPALLKVLVTSLYLAFFISFMLEPVLQGWITFFTLFCFLTGIIQKLNTYRELSEKTS